MDIESVNSMDEKYYKQFLFSKVPCKSFDYMKQEKFLDYYLYVSNDLELTIFQNGEISIIIIGYILDPDFPKMKNIDIAHELHTKSNSLHTLIDYINKLSGRFVLLNIIQNDIYIFNDPCGLRTVYYSNINEDIYIGSQPLIIKEVADINKSKDYDNFIKSHYYQNTTEYWLPCGVTLYENISQLLPNHYLKTSDCIQIRYWPNKNIKIDNNIDLTQKKISHSLNQIIKSIQNRYKLAVPLTAGFDSRILFCACKDIAQRVLFYTLKYRNLSEESNDIKIPKKILQSFKLKHLIYDCTEEPSESFKHIYTSNCHLAHDDWMKIAYGIYLNYPNNRICLKGNASEIARCYYYPSGSHSINNVEDIIKVIDGWEELKFIHEPLRIWFDDAKKVADSMNINILDLFYWEHRMGSWQAQSQLEWDIVQEAYTPFNHRPLLELLLSTPVKLRIEPHYKLYNDIGNILWEEAMAFPINPPENKRQQIVLTLKSLGIYYPLVKIYKVLKLFLKRRV